MLAERAGGEIAVVAHRAGGACDLRGHVHRPHGEPGAGWNGLTEGAPDRDERDGIVGFEAEHSRRGDVEQPSRLFGHRIEDLGGRAAPRRERRYAPHQRLLGGSQVVRAAGHARNASRRMGFPLGPSEHPSRRSLTSRAR